jgi:hypothetical protein
MQEKKENFEWRCKRRFPAVVKPAGRWKLSLPESHRSASVPAGKRLNLPKPQRKMLAVLASVR